MIYKNKNKTVGIFSLVKKFEFFKTVLSFLFFLFAGGVIFAETEVTTITITNARQTTYTKDEKNGNDTIVLEGSVEVSVSKGTTSSEIKADKITYDRKTEMLYAEGNVEILTKSSLSGGETTTASALLMNTATLEGAFDDGRIVQTQSDALNLPSGSTLIVFADIFGKSENNTIAFKDSSLTFCDDENPHWHIDATRTWLLPGGEFAFFNAFLYVGYIPVLYLPAFYYPKDELVFNPVFSTSRREGYAIHNTIYLYGRKPLTDSASSSSSDSTSAESLKALYNFMKPSTLKEQKLEGLVLHNLDEDYTGDTSKYIKLMGDYYSNLGAMVGLDANLSPAPKYISKLAFNAYLGFSNTIFTNDSLEYVNFNPMTGEIIRDSSTFLGVKLPFRYSGNFEISIIKPFKLSLSLPFYSDPFFAYDFKDNRSESMDWISYFMDFSTVDQSSVTVSEVSSFTWSMNGSFSPNLPDILKPYVSSFSSNLNSSVVISTMTANQSELLSVNDEYDIYWANNTPYRKFYYPSQVTPASVTMNLSGTIFEWPKKNNTTKSQTPNFSVPLTKPDYLKTESEKQNEYEVAKKEAEKNITNSVEENNLAQIALNENSEIENKETESDIKDSFVKPVFPDLPFSITSSSIASGFSYRLGYSIAPSFSTQISYASENLKKSEDFDWENVRAYMYSIKVPTSISSNLNYGSNFFGLTNKISYDPIWQKHPIISTDVDEGGYTVAGKKSLILSDYNAESQNVSAVNSVSFMPFAYTEHFADTGISWNSTVRLYRKKFIGDADSPEWEEYALDLDNEDCVTVNSVNLTLGTSELSNKFKQTLELSSVLPPLLRQYTGKFNLIFPYVTASVATGYAEQTHDESVADEERWKLNPLQQSLTISLLNNNLKLSESYNYNLEEKYNDSLKFTASWKSLYLSYIMSYTYGYDFDEEEGWLVRDMQEFLPYSLSFSFSPSTKTFYRWRNRISIAPGLNTSIVADLLRPTNSYFLFTPSLTFKINEFFDLSFSSTSRNQVLYRYIQSFIGKDGLIPGEQNPFKDLIDSFRFDDENIRKGSGFKLKSLNMSMSHELHDWSFNMTFQVEPKLVYKKSQQMYTYDATPYITVGIVWNPMDSIKTNLVYKYDDSWDETTGEGEKGVWSLE